MDHNTLATSQGERRMHEISEGKGKEANGKNEVPAAAKEGHNTKNGTESKQKLQGASGEETSEGNQSQSGRNVAGDVAPTHVKSHGEVNMEAEITVDDVIRAGGLGARDDLSCVLPIAADATDFEASILDARGYEGPRESIRRPGLGWTEPEKK